MLLRDPKQLKQPSGWPVSLAISQQGDLYAGWSTGAIMTLPRDSNTLQVYVKGSTIPSSAVKHRTPRSEFGSVHPIAIDAWSVNYTQYVGDGYLNRILEVSENFVTVVAGTGATGRKDGDGLTEATFESIRSIAVLPKYIAVLSKYAHHGAIRLIDRTTHRVTTLTESPSNTKDALQLLNAFQSSNPNIVNLATKSRTLLLPTTPDIQPSEDPKICIFRSANKTIEAGRHPASTHLMLTSSLDNTPLEPQALDLIYVSSTRSFLPVYCPISDSLFAIREGVLYNFRHYFGRMEGHIPSTIDLSDVTNLLDPSGLTPDLEITHEASNTTFRLFRSIIDRNMQGKSITAASEQLAQFVRSSTLPVAIITLLIERLYFRPATTFDSQQLITLAWILKEVFGNDNPIITRALQRRIKVESAEIVCDLLISSWTNLFGPFELDETSLIVATMLPRVQQNQSGFELALDAFMAKQSSIPHHMLARIASLRVLVTGPPLEAKFPKVKLLNRQPLSPIMVRLDPSHFVSLCSTNFAITLSPSTTIGVCGWLLYVHWPWFKRLIDSGLQESKTRIINLQSLLYDASALKAVITMLQFGHCVDSLIEVPLQDAICILDRASEFELVDLDGRSLHRIAPLIKECEATAFPPLTVDNCWNQLRLAHSMGYPKYSDIIQFIIDTVKTPMDELENLPEEVGADLIRKLNAEQTASSQPTNGCR